MMTVALIIDLFLHGAIVIAISFNQDLYPYRQFGFGVMGAFLTTIVDCLFIAYLIRSNRVNVTYRHRVVNVDEPRT